MSKDLVDERRRTCLWAHGLMASWSVLTGSPRQTMGWGSRLGKLLEGGEIIALIGELGAGKTCFVRGVTQALR